ncbi:histidine kinase N-terminal 7TM domain-containing protein [Paenibacillus thalictri]|uniref:histidine kinase n=1 Tax=Paenibacillus thalictri TaxID=2527873 RepID=A0A4Q9DMW3_9BACL|nr:histidine kinase N-terminal 7TM domain-containing protein [Paenibacillus thalictri]TBL76124.1 hypothetical protein EYB31_21520 [Paenibacillus thalictri]
MTYLTIDLVVMAISTVITVFIGIYAYENRREHGARYLAWVMLFDSLNSCGSIFERISDTLTEKLYWFNFNQSAHIFTIPYFLFFVLEYVGQQRLLRSSKIFAILIYFALWVSLIWTDSYHHLLRYDIKLQEDVLTFSSTGLSVCLNIFGFMALFAALCYLGVYSGRSGSLARKQMVWIWLSVTLPILWVIVGLVNPLPPILWGLYTAVINGIMGLCLFLAIFKYKLLKTLPIAKDQVVEMMLDGVLVADETGAVIDSNASARRLFAGRAVSSAELAGRSIEKLLAPWPQWRNACERMQQDELEIEIGEKEQSRVYTVKVVPLHSASKRKLGTVSVMSDITENRRRYEQMEQLNRLKDELFAIVSHDIRDPLAVLLNLTEMLEEERPRLSEESGEVFDAVKEKVTNAYAMVENLLEWARSQRGGMTLHARSIVLSSVVQEAAKLLQSKSEVKHIRIRNEVRDNIQVCTDREAVSLILRNLLSNAVKYTKPGGVVCVDAEETDEKVVVTVRDNGVGIGPERMKLLFGGAPVGSFSGTLGERGTGIGLLVCKELVQRSGGEIGVNSAPGEGSMFYFSLPRVIS